MAYLDASAQAQEGSPLWRQAVAHYRNTLLSRVVEPGFFVPIEFADAQTEAEAFCDLQQVIAAFGRLLIWWPVMWTLARDWEGGGRSVLR